MGELLGTTPPAAGRTTPYDEDEFGAARDTGIRRLDHRIGMRKIA
jgi:hypothetical protein